LAIYLCDATWPRFSNPKEDIHASVESLGYKLLVKAKEDLLVLMLACNGSLVVVRDFMVFLGQGLES
jgi:hypothetical protein